jgi:predicted ATPase/class 3 adenylate cyclase
MSQSATASRTSRLPSGTITFLFTDIEGSTRRWEADAKAMSHAIARHDAILRRVIEAHQGYVVKMIGDACCSAFPTAEGALDAALEAQRAFSSEHWGTVGEVRIRAAVHTGAAEERDGDYFGQPLNRVARLLSAGHGGQILVSGVTHELLRERMHAGVSLRDLGEHRLKDLILPEHVFQVAAAGLHEDFPALKTLDAHPTNLPIQPTPLIGREREVPAVCGLLQQEDIHLVTLTGAGGTGKTRLALQVAAEVVEDFSDGVFLVPLAPITEPSLVPSAIAASLGLREEGGEALEETVRLYLKDKAILLILDNFEQVLDAAARIGELMRTCARLKVLATSRAVLRLYGERDYAVPPLAVPDPRKLPPLDELIQYESVALFIQRAAAVKTDFALTNETARAVAEICYRLDGLPLAIELAAARIPLLPPKALLERLSSRLQLLTGGARDLPARHQTLRAAIDWSYALLDEAEKALFRRLAIFVGGWSLKAAEAVCVTDVETTAELDIFGVLEGTGSLVDKSLIRRIESMEAYDDADPRFLMLETIREYALERLNESGETESTSRRHAQYFLELAERAAPGLEGANQEKWLGVFETEHDNVRSALAYLLALRDGPAMSRLALAAGRFWRLRGHFAEGRRWLQEALDTRDTDDATRGKLLYRAGSIASRQSDFAESQRLQSEGLALARTAGDRENVANCLNGLGVIALAQGDDGRASEYFNQSLIEYRDVGDAWGTAACLQNLGNIALGRNQYDVARSLYTESLAQWRELDDSWGIAFCLSGLAGLAIGTEDYEAAVTLATESLEIEREMGDKVEVAYAQRLLGVAQGHLGHTEDAFRLLGESISTCHELGNVEYSLDGLREMAALAHKGAPGRAARLWGAVDALTGAAGVEMDQSDRDRYDRQVAAARTLLDETAWSAAWAGGQRLSLENAVTYALAMAAAPKD